MSDIQVPVNRLLTTIGALKVENDLLREQLAARELELQAARAAIAAEQAKKTTPPTIEAAAGTIRSRRRK